MSPKMFGVTFELVELLVHFSLNCKCYCQWRVYKQIIGDLNLKKCTYVCYFQQDRITSHTTRQNIELLRFKFQGRLILHNEDMRFNITRLLSLKYIFITQKQMHSWATTFGPKLLNLMRYFVSYFKNLQME